MADESAKVQLITGRLFEELVAKAAESPRRRINYNLHGSASDNPHRFLNVFLKGSYVAPHRHLQPPKAESFIVLEGRMAAFVFDDSGIVQAAHILGDEPGMARGVDLGPGIWHTVTALTAHAVCFEVKPGPWDPANDKEFAPWAPREGDPGAGQFLDWLLHGAAKSSDKLPYAIR